MARAHVVAVAYAVGRVGFARCKECVPPCPDANSLAFLTKRFFFVLDLKRDKTHCLIFKEICITNYANIIY